MKFTVTPALSLVALVPIVSSIALPEGSFLRVPRSLPDGTQSIAMDETSGALIAYDSSGEKLGVVPQDDEARNVTSRAVSGACTALSKDDLQKLPGWQNLQDAAKKNWGDGKYNLVTNPEEYKDRPANICISDDEVQITKSGKPACKTSTQSTEGKLVGTEGEVALTWNQGTTYSTSATVTQEASIANGFTTSVKVGIPDVDEVTFGTSTTLTFTNTQSKATESTENNQQSQQVTIKADKGKTCKLDVTASACSISGSGEVQYIATGWAWFNYEDKVDGHYKWALNIESTLNDVKDRSSAMKFDTAIETSTHSKYNGVCN